MVKVQIMGVIHGARVTRVLGTTKHYRGLPPELNGGTDARMPMPSPDIVIEVNAERHAMLFRYT